LGAAAVFEEQNRARFDQAEAVSAFDERIGKKPSPVEPSVKDEARAPHAMTFADLIAECGLPG
jgi:hypothetical protein